MTTIKQPDVLIVGAGWAGMYALHRLRRLGYTALILEAGSDVGGTWYWNRYPGARCDIESTHYSYSFDEDLQQEWTWTERYPSQPELLAYAHHVAERFDLRKDIHFDTQVTNADWDPTNEYWTLATQDGENYSAPFCIMATGPLSAPKSPEISGLDSFSGSVLNTSNWPEDVSDFSKQRVAVIGTGSSGIQVIPEIAKTAEQLYVLQRTASYSLPAHNRPLKSDEIATAKEQYPELRNAARESFDGLAIPNRGLSAFDVVEEERDEIYQEVYAKGAPFEFQGTFTDQMTDIAANQTAAEFVAGKIEQRVDDPATAEALTPSTYPIATRRLCIDTDYYETFNRSNVKLIDLLSDPIDRVTEAGIKTEDHQYDVDTIVLATGFDAITGALNRIEIRGNNGQLLRDKWRDHISSYLGLMVNGFPNMFTVTGPLSPSVLSNMMVSLEHHVEWITDCIDYLSRKQVTTIEPTIEAELDWSKHANDVAEGTLFPQSDSWYMGANVEGKSRQMLPYVGGVGHYRQITNKIAAAGYRGFELHSSAQSAVR